MKDFKTLDEQVDKLKAKGVLVEDVEDAKKKLLIGNYYNIVNGYKGPFLTSLNPDVFISGTKFQEIYDLYDFDRQIRSIIFPGILSIESILRSLISHHFSSKYGQMNYLTIDNFDQMLTSSYETRAKRKTHILDLMPDVHGALSNAIGRKDYITHYVSKYGFVPLWVLVNDLTLGQLSKFYSLMKQPERVNVSKYWPNLLHVDLESYLKILSYFRNLCAHDDRIYNAKSKSGIPDTVYHQLLNVSRNPSGNYISGKYDFFALLITFKVLMPSSEFNTIVNKIDGRIISLKKKLTTVSIDDIIASMGLPKDWYLIKK